MAELIQSTRLPVLAIVLTATVLALPAQGQETTADTSCQEGTDTIACRASNRSALQAQQPESAALPDTGQATPPSSPQDALQPLSTLSPQAAQGQISPFDAEAWKKSMAPEKKFVPIPLTGRGSAAELNAGLTWEFCGPRPGGNSMSLLPVQQSSTPVPVDIIADRADYDRNADVIYLQGDVQIHQGQNHLEADRSTYVRQTGQTHAVGRVFIDYQGLRIQGDQAEYNLQTKEGKVDHARYRLSGNANLRGTAKRAHLLSEARSRYEDIIYTTCPPGNSSWSIRASKLKLDRIEGLGTARNARIRVGDVPVFYTPYLRFPIDDRRRSGFLIPTIGTSDETGTDITIPYYWNVAPNMDATLRPRYMSSRGVMLGGEFRYLSKYQNLRIDGEVLPDDRNDPEDGTRSALKIEQSGHFGGRWSTSVYYESVSDSDYIDDFGNGLDVTSVRNLTQRFDLTYSGDGWNLLTRIQRFQTVDDTIASADRPYSQKPHIELNIDPKIWDNLLEYSFNGQYDYFDHPTAVHGNRFVAIPTLRLPFRRGFGYLIPRARLYYTAYDLTDQEGGLANQMTHAIPSFDLDGKLIFERHADWFGQNVVQTLEPRLYYVVTAYEDQSDNPLFDTTALDFSYDSLFRPNRFTGYDRISDENRLTIGVTSRTISSRTGDELFRASLGQIYYFDNRRVQLSGDDVEDDGTSAIAGEISAQIYKDWTARLTAQWDPNEEDQPWEKRVLQLRYTPGDHRVLNLAYRYNYPDTESERYENADLSFQMPLGSNVQLVGRWMYSVLTDETVEAFAGIEFGRCCWRMRLVGMHEKTSSESSGNTSIMLQVELAGLGAFGNSLDTFLGQEIYGYQND